jgi:soluble lytic murein transglycosylase
MTLVKISTSFVIKMILWTLSASILLAVVFVGIKYIDNRQNKAKLAELENVIKGLRSAMNIDSIRQYNIQRIIAIINQYNLQMPTHQKYDIAEEIYSMSIKYGNLSVDLICATITHETAGTWNPEVVSPAGAIGLMQLMPTTGMFVASYEQLTWTSPEEILSNPIYNIRIGARYLSSLIEMYDVDGGLAAYNGGERRAALWLGSGKSSGILARETQEYVPAIRKLYEEFQAFRL